MSRKGLSNWHGQVCDVVIKVFMCIKTAWNRVRNMFATVLTTITTVWIPVLTLNVQQISLTTIKPIGKIEIISISTTHHSELDKQ